MPQSVFPPPLAPPKRVSKQEDLRASSWRGCGFQIMWCFSVFGMVAIVNRYYLGLRGMTPCPLPFILLLFLSTLYRTTPIGNKYPVTIHTPHPYPAWYVAQHFICDTIYLWYALLYTVIGLFIGVMWYLKRVLNIVDLHVNLCRLFTVSC